MQAVWHGEMQLITDLDRVFEQGEDKNIDVVKREVKKRGAAVVNQERTKAEKEKTQKTKAKKK